MQAKHPHSSRLVFFKSEANLLKTADFHFGAISGCAVSAELAGSTPWRWGSLVLAKTGI
jgi:hypothetical protein